MKGSEASPAVIIGKLTYKLYNIKITYKPFLSISRSAHGVIIVYDITKRDTFLSLQKWINEVRNYTASNVVCALVGNKCDLTEEREVSVEDAEEVCSIIPEILFSIETSAKENTNVENAFARIAEELMVSLKKVFYVFEVFSTICYLQNRQSCVDDEPNDGIKLGQSKSVSSGGCNC